MRKYLTSKYLKGDQRTVLLKKNIIGSFIIKGWTCLVQLILVPVTLDCLNQYEYGIWLTINSLLIWIDSFDIGLGNGLRNKLTESIANNDYDKGRRQISTTLFMLILIMSLSVVLLLYIVNYLINPYTLLNVNKSLIPNLPLIITTAVCFVGATFVFKFIGNVYLALQLPAINNLLIAFGQTIALILIFFCSKNIHTSLLDIAICYTAAPLFVYLLSYPITFTRYKLLSPKISLFDKREIEPLFSLGIKFFFIQIGGLIIFASSNILISKIFSPNEVTPYQIAYRYFGLTSILFTIISAPLWSATTDAYMKEDWNWIKDTIRKMRKIMLVIFGMIVLMLLCANSIYRLWVGGDIQISFYLSLGMALYMIIIVYGTCYSNIICGIGKIRLLTIITILEAIIYIPLAIIMSNYFNVVGIVYALIIVNLLSALFNKLQFERIIKKKAKGIWFK